MTVGERIKQKRIEIGLSQDELAKRMGYKNKSAICRVERDYEQNLTLDRVSMFARALGCSESYLMGWEEEPTKEEALTPSNASALTRLIGYYPLFPYYEKLGRLSSHDKEIVCSLIDTLSERGTTTPS